MIMMPMDSPQSWVVEIFEQANSPKGIRNALRFDTPENANHWLSDLSMRWFGFDHGVVVETTDAPNHTIIDNKLTQLEEKS